MKQLIIISGILLSLLGYGAGQGSDSATASFIDGIGETRGLFIWAIGFFGSIAGTALFLAVFAERRRTRRDIASYSVKLDEFRESIRKQSRIR
jgi:hypothetical protein